MASHSSMHPEETATAMNRPMQTALLAEAEGDDPSGRWESQIADYLDQLMAVQAECLGLLRAKQAAVAAMDLAQLTTLQAAASTLVQKLESCLARRNQLLAEASRRGLSAASLHELVRELPPEERDLAGRHQLEDRFRAISWEWRLLQHQAVANWLLLQRSLLHISQLLEIIATGGQGVPTYSIGVSQGDSRPGELGGNLVDQRI